MSAGLRLALLHPELGLGGAERLMLDAALALQARGHAVRLYTAQRDPVHSFPASRDGRLDVRVRGRLPLHLAGRLRLPLAVARMLALGAAVRRDGGADALLVDCAAQAVPLLRRLTGAPLVYYGNFPDLLLAPPRHGWYRFYRWPLDRWEAAGLAAADQLLCNSAFTAAAFHSCFPRLRPAVVLHPGVDLARLIAGPPPSRGHLLLAVSRLVGAKRLELAVEALAALRQRLAPAAFAPLRLVIAGGYDARLRECRDTAAALAARAAAHGLAERVEIRRSPSDAEVQALLGAARVVLYTPPEEHFGYVPIEAMAAGRPVVAVDAGGPRETVRDGVTGFLRPPDPAAFAAALQPLIEDPAAADALGAAGRAHVAAHFSLAAFGAGLEAALRRAVSARRAARLAPPPATG